MDSRKPFNENLVPALRIVRAACFSAAVAYLIMAVLLATEAYQPYDGMSEGIAVASFFVLMPFAYQLPGGRSRTTRTVAQWSLVTGTAAALTLFLLLSASVRANSPTRTALEGGLLAAAALFLSLRAIGSTPPSTRGQPLQATPPTSRTDS